MYQHRQKPLVLPPECRRRRISRDHPRNPSENDAENLKTTIYDSACEISGLTPSSTCGPPGIVAPCSPTARWLRAVFSLQALPPPFRLALGFPEALGHLGQAPAPCALDSLPQKSHQPCASRFLESALTCSLVGFLHIVLQSSPLLNSANFSRPLFFLSASISFSNWIRSVSSSPNSFAQNRIVSRRSERSSVDSFGSLNLSM